MDKNPSEIAKMQAEQGREQIKRLQDKLDTTRYNMEVSEEIIGETPSNAQQEKLTRKNIRRQHGIASIEKDMQDVIKSLKD